MDIPKVLPGDTISDTAVLGMHHPTLQAGESDQEEGAGKSCFLLLYPQWSSSRRQERKEFNSLMCSPRQGGGGQESSNTDGQGTGMVWV